MCKVLSYPRSTYYDKKQEKSENKWKSKNKKLQEDILKYIMKVIKSMVPLRFAKN